MKYPIERLEKIMAKELEKKQREDKIDNILRMNAVNSSAEFVLITTNHRVVEAYARLTNSRNIDLFINDYSLTLM